MPFEIPLHLHIHEKYMLRDCKHLCYGEKYVSNQEKTGRPVCSWSFWYSQSPLSIALPHLFNLTVLIEIKCIPRHIHKEEIYRALDIDVSMNKISNNFLLNFGPNEKKISNKQKYRISSFIRSGRWTGFVICFFFFCFKVSIFHKINATVVQLHRVAVSAVQFNSKQIVCIFSVQTRRNDCNSGSTNVGKKAERFRVSLIKQRKIDMNYIVKVGSVYAWAVCSASSKTHRYAPLFLCRYIFLLSYDCG